MSIVVSLARQPLNESQRETIDEKLRNSIWGFQQIRRLGSTKRKVISKYDRPYMHRHFGQMKQFLDSYFWHKFVLEMKQSRTELEVKSNFSHRSLSQQRYHILDSQWIQISRIFQLK